MHNRKSIPLLMLGVAAVLVAILGLSFPMMAGGWRSGMHPDMTSWSFVPRSGSGNEVISADEVRAHFERLVDWQSNPRVMLGAVKEEGEHVVIDIVTRDNSLVDRFIVNRRTGAYRRAEG